MDSMFNGVWHILRDFGSIFRGKRWSGEERAIQTCLSSLGNWPISCTMLIQLSVFKVWPRLHSSFWIVTAHQQWRKRRILSDRHLRTPLNQVSNHQIIVAPDDSDHSNKSLCMILVISVQECLPHWRSSNIFGQWFCPSTTILTETEFFIYYIVFTVAEILLHH